MTSRVALLLPAFALAVLGIAAASLLLFNLSTSERTGSPLSAATADPTPADSQFQPGASVCQGILHRPDAGSRRVFPAIYSKRVETNGITIVGNADVSDEALEAARKTVARVFQNNDLEQRLADEGAYIVIAASDQGVLDLPEFACLGQTTNIDFGHVCGVADRADYPVATVNELDVTGDHNGPCEGLNVLYHEIGHLVQGWTISPADYFDVRAFYQQAIDKGIYRRGRDYATTNANEYFAESTQAYFLHQNLDGSRDRAWLQRNDPDMYNLLASIYGD